MSVAELELHEATTTAGLGQGDLIERREAAAYLAGLIDGEGYVKLYRNTRKGGRRAGQAKLERRISITSTDAGIIEACAQACDLLGIAHIVSRWYTPALEGRKRFCRVEIGRREAFQVVRREVPLRCAEKRDALEAILESYVGGNA